jgi:signal transduction histidine kinase/CheY-like chemotaxis protein
MNETPVQSGPDSRDSVDPPEGLGHGLAAAFDHVVDWFVPLSLRDDVSLRQRIHIFAVAHIVGVVPALGLAYVLYLNAPSAAQNMQWLVPLYLGAALFPFGLKIVPRLEVLASVSAQWFAFTVLISAHYYGGSVSPALPWLVPALATALYYLAPWPSWRNVNVALQLLQGAVFAVITIEFPPIAEGIPVDRLPMVELASAICVVGLMSIVTVHIWSMELAKQQELEREIVVRRTAEAERQRTEAELRRSRDHLAQSQRVGRIGSAEITHSPAYEARWSDELYRLLDRQPGSPVTDAEEFLDLVHPDDREFIRMRRQRERRGEYGGASEFRIVHRDGKERWVRRQAEPTEWENGRPSREVVIFIDITDQKESAEALGHLEEMLAQAHKMEAIGQLTGGVAHDFNNLLAVILGMLRLIEEELDRTVDANFDEMNEWLDTCIRAVNRGASLTKSMLAFSRRQALKPTVLDANAVINDMTEMARRALGESYRLNVVNAPKLWPTETDAGQLQNAILNLLLNARDAVPSGGTLTVETQNVSLGSDYVTEHIDVSPGDYVELSVADTGVGMPPEVLKRAFDPFFTTKGVGKGSGLGLSMVYGFVKQSGGHVAIESAVGLGTTVRIFLPRYVGKTDAPAPTGRPSTSATSAGGTVLVVEDNEDLRLITCRQIERLGYKVIDAVDAAMGIDRLRSHPDTKLLVSDVMLPHGVSGVELAEQALSEFPRIKVVFMSGHNEEHEAFDRIRGRVPIRLLQKPFQPSELAAQIHAVLN